VLIVLLRLHLVAVAYCFWDASIEIVLPTKVNVSRNWSETVVSDSFYRAKCFSGTAFSTVNEVPSVNFAYSRQVEWSYHRKILNVSVPIDALLCKSSDWQFVTLFGGHWMAAFLTNSGGMFFFVSVLKLFLFEKKLLNYITFFRRIWRRDKKCSAEGEKVNTHQDKCPVFANDLSGNQGRTIAINDPI